MPSARIPVYEHYSDYKPTVNVTKIVGNLLAGVPDRYLLGLGSVVLLSQSDSNRSARRRKLKSRRKKVSSQRVLGLYRQAWRGQPASIELYVDRIFAGIPRPALKLIPLLSTMYVGKVLFHELGHHIDYCIRPEHREKEDVADDWSKKLLRDVVRQRYRYLLPALRYIFVPILRLFLAMGQPLKLRYEQSIAEKNRQSNGKFTNKID